MKKLACQKFRKMHSYHVEKERPGNLLWKCSWLSNCHIDPSANSQQHRTRIYSALKLGQSRRDSARGRISASRLMWTKGHARHVLGSIWSTPPYYYSRLDFTHLPETSNVFARSFVLQVIHPVVEARLIPLFFHSSRRRALLNFRACLIIVPLVLRMVRKGVETRVLRVSVEAMMKQPARGIWSCWLVQLQGMLHINERTCRHITQGWCCFSRLQVVWSLIMSNGTVYAIFDLVRYHTDRSTAISHHAWTSRITHRTGLGCRYFCLIHVTRRPSIHVPFTLLKIKINLGIESTDLRPISINF